MDLSEILRQIFAATGVSTAQLPADVDFSLGNVLRSIFILVLVYLLARFLRGVLQRGLRRAKFDARVEQLVVQVTYYGIITLGIIWILGGFGLSVVILGVAVGFAFKDLIQNFAAGLLIMATRPFSLGDWIVVGTSEGRVAQIGWRGTFLDTFDGRRVIIPNANIITNVVTNNSLGAQLRSEIKLTLDVKSDVAEVERQVLRALENIDGISKNPPPRVLMESLTTGALNILVQFWILDAVNQQPRVVSEAVRAVREILHPLDVSE